MIYMYRQRNLTGVSKKLLGIQVYPDGVIRTAFAGFAESEAGTCSIGCGSPR